MSLLPTDTEGLRCLLLARTWVGPNGCWYYGRGRHDRPAIYLQGKAFLVSRVILLCWSGVPLDKRCYVCHKCDNPRCVRPSHIYAGTAKTNSLDRERRGRSWAKFLPKHLHKAFMQRRYGPKVVGQELWKELHLYMDATGKLHLPTPLGLKALEECA